MWNYFKTIFDFGKCGTELKNYSIFWHIFYFNQIHVDVIIKILPATVTETS